MQSLSWLQARFSGQGRHGPPQSTSVSPWFVTPSSPAVHAGFKQTVWAMTGAFSARPQLPLVQSAGSSQFWPKAQAGHVSPQSTSVSPSSSRWFVQALG
jgi:hypothetical protein